MAAMTKRVNINAPVAIRNITPPIYGTCNNIVMSTGDILKCLCKRAKVEEILPDGSTVILTMKNYYTDNGAGLDAEKVKPATVKIEKVEDDTKKDELKVEIATDDIISEESTVSDAVDTTPAIIEEGNITESEENVVKEELDIVDTEEAVEEASDDVIVDTAVVEDIEVGTNTTDPVSAEAVEESTETSEVKTTTTKKSSSKKKSSNNK